ncbi:hypothetical protein L1987_43443 [Smallanthus sonchifolius]|uniref:Uncharacterized protein n=1 Tax=Smallanthus sonchifolius TaxID=185202 RepID=A0ACB9GMM8_9ASTR|nr:hypothetical protein L1987_43443 [Smallanthus sonchifolius]
MSVRPMQVICLSMKCIQISSGTVDKPKVNTPRQRYRDRRSPWKRKKVAFGNRNLLLAPKRQGHPASERVRVKHPPNRTIVGRQA